MGFGEINTQNIKVQAPKMERIETIIAADIDYRKMAMGWAKEPGYQIKSPVAAPRRFFVAVAAMRSERLYHSLFK